MKMKHPRPLPMRERATLQQSLCTQHIPHVTSMTKKCLNSCSMICTASQHKHGACCPMLCTTSHQAHVPCYPMLCVTCQHGHGHHSTQCCALTVNMGVGTTSPLVCITCQHGHGHRSTNTVHHLSAWAWASQYPYCASPVSMGVGTTVSMLCITCQHGDEHHSTHAVHHDCSMHPDAQPWHKTPTGLPLHVVAGQHAAP
jgi:hypothetical protein